MHVLIVKHSALGDVVRTSYFAQPLKEKFGPQLRISWITSDAATCLLSRNKFIDDVWTNFCDAEKYEFDTVYSLDDELPILERVSRLRFSRVVGAFLAESRRATYSPDSASWFDMGLLSIHGKNRADELKKRNTDGHAQIFARIFGVGVAEPTFFGDPQLEAWAREWIGSSRPIVGINPFAGGRWPSKQLPSEQLEGLLKALKTGASPFGPSCTIVLLGLGRDRELNEEIANRHSSCRVRVANTDDSPLRLAAIIRSLDYLITSDSLAMHLSISQGIRTLAFFAPTSAAEIDGFGVLSKICSRAPDYCSYQPHASNTDITAARILEGIEWSKTHSSKIDAGAR